MNKNIIAGALVLSAALALSACTSEPVPAPIKVTETSAPASVPEPTMDDIFVQVVREEVANLEGTPDSTIIETGHATCDALDAGVPFLELLEISLDSGFTAYEAGAIVGASVAAYCPEYQGALDDFAGQIA